LIFFKNFFNFIIFNVMRKRIVTNLQRNPVETSNGLVNKFRTSRYQILLFLLILVMLSFLFSLEPSIQAEKKEKKKEQVFSIGSNGRVIDRSIEKISKPDHVENPEALVGNPVKWSLTTSDKCDAIFGNGWDEPTFSCKGPSSSISCYRNKVTMSTYCKANNIVIDSTKIRVSPGREAIKDVAGRAEDDEFCKYSAGAFVIPGASCKGSVGRKEEACHITDMMQSIGSKGLECTEPSRKTAVIITRYEYCNLYHTMTDWYNT